MTTTSPTLSSRLARHLVLGFWLALLAALPRAMAAEEDATAKTAPLRQVTLTAYRLQSARLDVAYRRALHGSGGTPPYLFALSSGKLPDGISLDGAGVLSGKPSHTGHYDFTVMLTDSQGQSVLQGYVLSVFKPASKPVAATPTLTALSSEQAQAQPAPSDETLVHVYRLAPEVLALLKPSEEADEDDSDTEEDAAPTGTEPAAPAKVAAEPAEAKAKADAGPAVPLDAAQVEQLKTVLQPLLGVEYPSRPLFEAALDAQLCAFVRDLADTAAATNKQAPPDKADFAKACPPDWPALAKAAKGKAPAAPSPSAAVPWQQLAPRLMPPALRDWLVDTAHQPHPLVPGLPPLWDDAHCGCVLDQLSGEIYGFYPLWLAQGKPQTVSFDLLTRISYFALPFDDSGQLGKFDSHSTAALAFVRSARRHGTHLDLTLYRNDWKSLLALPAAKQDEAIVQATHQAVRLIDTRLDDIGSRIKAWLPGFAEAPRVADGITLYFEDLPREDATQRAAFMRFMDKFMTTLIAEMRKGDHPYALNLVLQPRDLMDPQATWEVTTLFQWLLLGEDPVFKDGRIATQTEKYRSRTNVTLRFVVLLPEPTTSSKKLLRQFIENSPALQGENRRVFMRKTIPVMTAGTDPSQFADDMAYMADNFGGVGFWPLGIIGENSTREQERLVRNFFLSSPPIMEGLCDYICEYRWPLRFAFDLLLLIGAVSLVLYLRVCRIRRLGRGFLIYLLVGAMVTAVVGALLLECDPNLRAVREGNALLWTLVAGLAIAALFFLLKPRVEQP